MSRPLKYNINNFGLIAHDIEKRAYFYKKTASLLERKAEIDYNYADTLEHMINKEFIKNTNNSIPSQLLYSKLVEIILEEPQRVRKMADSIKNQSEKMIILGQNQSGELKKMLESAGKINKDIQSQREKLEKNKLKYDKKNQELELAKIKYLSCVMSTEHLQKVNELYLQVSNLEQTVKPLLEDYKVMATKFHESVSKMVEQFNIFLEKIEEIEEHKIQNIKKAVNKYVRVSKLNLDEVMEKYPFLCEFIDRIRETLEFVPHSEHSLIFEGQQLGSIMLRESDYIDSIYDRIQKKKNLEEIILYGQNIEHKKNLTCSFTQLSISEALELSPKTKRMIEIFKAVFDGNASKQMIDEFSELLRKDQKLRKDFILCLQQFRLNNEFQLNIRSKQCITSCTMTFLDVCHEELDTYNSKMFMVLSMTYHFKEENGKVQLYELIKNHHIWTHIDWWQAALIETIYEEIKVKSNFKEVPVKIWDIKAGGICRKQEGEEQTYQYICFNQLLFFIRNMGLFNLDHQQIIQYAKLNINVLKFTGKLAKDILDLCPQSPLLRKKDMSLP